MEEASQVWIHAVASGEAFQACWWSKDCLEFEQKTNDRWVKFFYCQSSCHWIVQNSDGTIMMQFSLLQANMCYAYERQFCTTSLVCRILPYLTCFSFFHSWTKFWWRSYKILGTKSSALCHTVLFFCQFTLRLKKYFTHLLRCPVFHLPLGW